MCLILDQLKKNFVKNGSFYGDNLFSRFPTIYFAPKGSKNSPKRYSVSTCTSMSRLFIFFSFTLIVLMKILEKII